MSDLNIILRDMDEVTLPNGSVKTFSIAFVTKRGIFVFLKRARKSGTTQNQRMHDFKGVQALNQDYEPIGHPYPVHIHAILYYNGTFEKSFV